MKNVLQREFLLVDINNQVCFSGSLVELFKLLKYSFISSIGLEMQSYTKKIIDIRYINGSVPVRYVRCDKVSNVKYTVRDGFGRKYCPKYLIALLEEAYPNLFKGYGQRYSRNYGFKRYTKNRCSKYRYKSHPRLLKQSENSVNECDKKLRKIHGYYCDGYERALHKNWKKFRAKQYK